MPAPAVSVRSRAACALAVAAALAGCRTVAPAGPSAVGELPEDFGRHSRADVLARLAAADTLRGVEGEATLVVQAPQQSGTFDARLAARADGHAHLSVGQFGITGGRVLVRPDSAFVHNALGGELLVAPARRAAALLPVPVAPEELFRVLTGTLRPADADAYTLSVDRPNGLYLLRAPDGRQVVSVDPRVWRVVRVVRYATAGGGVTEELLWQTYSRVGGAVLPRRVTVRQPGTSTVVTLLLNGVAPTPAPSIPPRLSVPSGTRVRPL